MSRKTFFYTEGGELKREGRETERERGEREREKEGVGERKGITGNYLCKSFVLVRKPMI